MGAARAKKTRNVRLLEQHPFCIYCGGTKPAAQVDHAPPISIFTLRRRPEGLEFPACPECHEGTRKLDTVAAFYARLYPDPNGEAEQDEVRRLYRGMINSVPVIGIENALNRDRTSDYALGPKASELLGPGAPMRIVGPWVRRYLDAFFARMALALHYNDTGIALPDGAVVYVRTLTNTALLRGDVPPEVLGNFGQLRALVQKGLKAEEEFSFATARGRTAEESLIFVNLRLSVGAVAVCLPRPEAVGSGWSTLAPGFLKMPLYVRA